ncbi:hypothetical protein [Rhodococcus sp. ANT_H53B]|uniref:hypothetical protein n=1 Tax=Rhodococcus sp. ANT_H53B TaxID=2597357 RepID=UPI0011F07219|nr:hypothetical protein [Rhodococcus sp. ANT_H53B]
MTSSRGSTAAFLALSVIACALTGHSSVAAQELSEPSRNGSVGIRLLEAPVSLQGDPRALTYIVDNLPPGTTITRKVEVRNGADEERTISMYAAAASVGQSGFTVADDRAVNELSTWMSVSPSEATVPPNSTAQAVVTIDVPSDAPEGEQYAVIWAQVTDNESGSGIQNVSRVGIRTYLSVGPGNGPPADLEVDAVTATRNANGAPELVATVANIGGRALDPQGTVTLSGGPGGISTSPVEAAGSSIAPGQSGTVAFAFDPALPSGPWQAEVTVTSGLVNKTSNVELTFPDQGSVAAQDSSSESGVPVWIWAVVALGIIAVAAAVLIVIRRRKTS